MRTLLLLLALSCFGVLADAAPVNLAERDGQLLISEALYDPTGQLSIQQVAASDAFRPRGQVTVPSLRARDSVLWLRFTLAKPPHQQGDWWLALSDVGLPEAVLYQSLGSAGFRRMQTGISEPFSTRQLPFRQMLLPLQLDEKPTVFYLRLHSRDDFAGEVELRSPATMALVEHGRGLLYGLIYGGIAALALYNLLMMRSLRERLYLPYVLASMAALLTIVSLNGHGYQYLWPDWPWLALHDGQLFPALWILMFRRYARRLLELRSRMPLLDRLGGLLVGLAILALLLHLAGAWFIGFWLGISCYGLVALYMMVVGLLRWHEGFRPAGYFLVGNLLLCASVSLVILMVISVIPVHWLGLNAIQLGIALQSLLLSLALADRVRTLRSEHESNLEQAFEVQRNHIAALRQHEEELESRVAQRTAELATSNAQLLDEVAARRRAEAQLKQSETQLRQQALHDPLTGLANRILLADRLQHALERQPRRRVPFALMLLDLDHFKPVNDRYGHEIGDLLLREVAERLRGAVRAADTVARLGGDEFVLLAELLALEDATSLASKLVGALTAPYMLAGEPVNIGVSIGIACYPGDGADADSLLRHADAAMYHVKRGGRNGYAFWHHAQPASR